jgi:hypothetical protein
MYRITFTLIVIALIFALTGDATAGVKVKGVKSNTLTVVLS